MVRAVRFLTVGNGIAMKCSLGECSPTFVRPLLMRMNPSLENNIFQESEVARLVVLAVICSVLSADLLANVCMRAFLN